MELIRLLLGKLDLEVILVLLGKRDHAVIPLLLGKQDWLGSRRMLENKARLLFQYCQERRTTQE